jgi:hypothetical protein
LAWTVPSPDYLGHRQVPAALRALTDMIRAKGGSTLAGRLGENPFAVE